jgi:hypothetical protein
MDNPLGRGILNMFHKGLEYTDSMVLMEFVVFEALVVDSIEKMDFQCILKYMCK